MMLGEMVAEAQKCGMVRTSVGGGRDVSIERRGAERRGAERGGGKMNTSYFSR